MALEENLKKLDDMVSKLKNSAVTIDEGLTIYTDALNVAKLCLDDISKNESQLKLLLEETSKILPISDANE
ncbi:MAG: exodeoxyribonuclease VII small subunit [Christensenellaceae bacterium]|jgi:exonuclease VII small subunit|nr:exodeoxyribonuclease VII small subunit [Christensenellaceae bacterium]